jgi:hypothetical protein
VAAEDPAASVAAGAAPVPTRLARAAASAAKEKAKRANCVSNLRQMGFAVTMYADDNEGRLPKIEPLPSDPLAPQ